jgi:uncharacterized protein YaaR (DUF327 family)
MYLVYAEGTTIRVVRSDGKLDDLTRIYSSIQAVETALKDLEYEILQLDVEQRNLSNGKSDKYPPKAGGAR